MLPPSFNWQQIRSNTLTTWAVFLVLVNLTLSIVITFTHIIYGLSVITLPNVYYVKCTRTFKRHVKEAGFVHAKKLLAHKFDPFPAVTLSEFCLFAPRLRRAGIKKPAIVFGSSLSVCQSRMKSSRSASASAHGISDTENSFHALQITRHRRRTQQPFPTVPVLMTGFFPCADMG